MFGCLEWESELYRGVMRARCYPYIMRGHSFHWLKCRMHSTPHRYTAFTQQFSRLHMGYPIFIQYLSLYCRTLWSLFLRGSVSLYLHEQSSLAVWEGQASLLGAFWWQAQGTVELSSRQTVLGVLLRRASTALR